MPSLFFYDAKKKHSGLLQVKLMRKLKKIIKRSSCRQVIGYSETVIVINIYGFNIRNSRDEQP
jgi:hypothetical protein